MGEPHWTREMVAAWLEEAADTLRRLPRVRVQGYVTAWPPIVHDYWEAFGWDETEARLGPPSAKAIDRMDCSLLWLRWLEREDQRIVWDRANGRPWKAIAHDYGIDRSTAWRHWNYAMGSIAVRLNKLKRQEFMANTEI